MAETMVEIRSNGSLNVIDLTLSDDDGPETASTSGRRAIFPSRLTPAATPLQAVGTPGSNHGLLLEGTFRSLSRSRLRSSGSGVSRGSSNSSTATIHRLKQLSDRTVPYWISRSNSPQKRRRTGSGSVSSVNESPRAFENGSDHDKAQDSTTVHSVSPKRESESIHRASTPGTSGDLTAIPRISGAINNVNIDNRILVAALQRQVFPHIHKCLSPYRQSLSIPIRKQFGKDVAHQICDGHFLAELERNSGYLSPAFETNISERVQTLISNLAGEALAVKQEDDNSLRQRSMTNSKATFSASDRVNISPLNSIKLSASQSQRLMSNMKAGKKFGKTSLPQRRANGIEPSRATKAKKKLVSQPDPSNSTFLNSSSEVEDGDQVVRNRSTTTFDTDVLNAKPSTLQPGKIPSKGRPLSSLPVRGGVLQEPFRSHRHSELAPGLRAHSIKTSSNDQIPRLNREPPSQASSAIIEKYMLRLAGLDSNISRPYLRSKVRKEIQTGLEVLSSKESYRKWHEQALLALQDPVFHVDFCDEEINYLVKVVQSVVGDTVSSLLNQDMRTDIELLMASREGKISWILDAISCDDENGLGKGHERGLDLVQNRTEKAITAFLKDAAEGLVTKGNNMIYLHTRPKASQVCSNVSSKCINSILRHRETSGMYRNPRGIRSFRAEILNAIEDDFVHEVEWTDCSGDIATVSWIPGDGFFCGATCHSDEHNMQYNKPGNFLIGSVDKRSLHSISGHQIARPLVAKGENSRASMRGTQDPWMYCSVTSTAYCYNNQKCFTGSYDQTVKIWNVVKDRTAMELCGIWEHAGNVNFVVTSPHHSMIATAADVRENSVRVYHFNLEDISASHFDTYGPSLQLRSGSDTWAYCPATMQWGTAPIVSHLLLVGFSPRAFTCQDADIPEDKSNTGELCLWNAKTNTQIPIPTARTQNVFEVIWHPSQPIFITATSPIGERGDHIKTQLRIFGQNEGGSFSHMKTLDCPAVDINEITVMPNSSIECYITASCTDGNTYVWDSAQGDQPIHVLSHGPPIDDQAHDLSREDFDVGVKFAAWGRTCDRFYTGSSDGAVKAWNIRSSTGVVFVRDVVNLSGGVSAGAFSPDFSKLVIGDSTGKIHLLSVPEEPGEKLPTIRQPITPHEPLSPPVVNDKTVVESEQTAGERAHEYLKNGQIIIHEDKYIGAIQGPNYATTGFFCPEGHKEGDIGKRVISEWRNEQNSRYQYKNISFSTLPEVSSSDKHLHEANIAKDLDPDFLSSETLAQLKEEGVDFQFENENVVSYESVWLGDERTIEVEDSRYKLGEADLLNEDSSCDHPEILEFQRLKKEISQELGLRRKLDLVLKELDN